MIQDHSMVALVIGHNPAYMDIMRGTGNQHERVPATLKKMKRHTQDACPELAP